jgi:hypothetical protein
MVCGVRVVWPFHVPLSAIPSDGELVYGKTDRLWDWWTDSQETQDFLVIADAAGGNAKTIVTDKGQFALNMVLEAIE